MLTNLILDPVYLIDTLEPIIKWVAIGLLIGTLITLLVVYLTDKNIFVKTEEYTAGKGTGELPTKPNKSGRSRESTGEGIPNIDSENDPKS